MPLAAGDQLGRYRILAPLGHGGMGEVYLAEDPRLNRRVALKIMNAKIAANETGRARFEREARMAAALDHPGICTLHEIGHDKGHDYLVMQLLRGETLQARLQRGRPPVDEALDIGIQLGEALAYAHAQGVLHRDIKPQNVMLTADGRVKLMDFGLAKPLQHADGRHMTFAEISQLGEVLGTVEYISPEQIAGKPADQRSDIFSLGLTLYEAFAGAHPLAGPNPAATISAISSKPAPPLTEFAPDAPKALEPVLAKALAIAPEDRYQSMADLVADLKKARRVPAEPVDPPRPQPRSFRRALVLTSVAALLALAGVLGWAQFGRGGGDHRLTTWLDIQQEADGAVRQAAGEIPVETNWRFRVQVRPPGVGSLYLLSDERVLPDGLRSLKFLYPAPDEVEAARRGSASGVQTPWYRITGEPTQMELWMVWSPKPVPELDVLKPFIEGTGEVTDTAKADAARARLDAAARRVRVTNDSGRALAQTDGDIVAYRFLLNQK